MAERAMLEEGRELMRAGRSADADALRAQLEPPSRYLKQHSYELIGATGLRRGEAFGGALIRRRPGEDRSISCPNVDL